MGLLFIGAMAFPLPAANPVAVASASLRRGRRSAWPARAGIALFVLTGISLVLHGIGLPTAARITGIGLLPLFAAVPNAILFGLNAPPAPRSSGPCGTGRSSRLSGMRCLATVTALWIDTFIRFALEVARKEFLPQSRADGLEKWTQGLLLIALSPMLLLLFQRYCCRRSAARCSKARWARWRSR